MSRLGDVVMGIKEAVKTGGETGRGANETGRGAKDSWAEGCPVP